ncbi:hypothetical protein SAY87_022350 [Trapa incisa]|uniref:Uncharacterized protein n=1 Tax=Trapa incisa TaxID=236973 RepID=A0AAN7K423_9MYRT|nr:hypothetical protein SAY87_022350 [Trapa incisa]
MVHATVPVLLFYGTMSQVLIQLGLVGGRLLKIYPMQGNSFQWVRPLRRREPRPQCHLLQIKSNVTRKTTVTESADKAAQSTRVLDLDTIICF